MNGVVYIATGEKYVQEARVSARTLRAHTNLSVTLFTDDEATTGAFDQVLPVADVQDITMKARTLRKSPYQNTLFLDSDTYILDDISDLFDILYRYDMAAAHAPRRMIPEVPIPAWFPEMNGGVLLFKNNAATMNLIDRWIGEMVGKQKTHESRVRMEQPSLRRALYNSPDVNLFILPPEYNMRLPVPTFVSRKVYILHGRGEQLRAAIQQVNSQQGMRLWLPTEHTFYKGR